MSAVMIDTATLPGEELASNRAICRTGVISAVLAIVAFNLVPDMGTCCFGGQPKTSDLIIESLFSPGAGCPLCPDVVTTISEELGKEDVAVIARLVKVHERSNKSQDEIPKATYEIERVLKGEGLVKPKEKFETLYLGDGTLGQSFLATGISPPATKWSGSPFLLTERRLKYLSEVVKLPKDGAERLIFFQEYLEDSDEMLAFDAYWEFAHAPYSQLRAIKPRLKHDQVVACIKNPAISASHRRLYLIILGVIGTEKDLPMIEEFVSSSDPKAKLGLNALIACYLTLKGETGLQLVEKLFLANDKADHEDIHAAVMAIRFHGTEGGIIDTKQLVKALHPLLEHPELAGLAIPDLAKWQDWTVMDKMFDLYRNANEKNRWVRWQVVNYLRACPLPKAKELLVECEKIDPAAVKRAVPVGPAAPAPAPGMVSALAEGVRPAAALRKTAPTANICAAQGVPWGVSFNLQLAHWSLIGGGR